MPGRRAFAGSNGRGDRSAGEAGAAPCSPYCGEWRSTEADCECEGDRILEAATAVSAATIDLRNAALSGFDEQSCKGATGGCFHAIGDRGLCREWVRRRP